MNDNGITNESNQSSLCCDQPVIEWASLTQICGDEEIIKSIAVAITEDAPESVKAIAAAIEAKDLSEIEMYSHKLKGAASTIGANQLASIASTIEYASQQGDLQTVIPSFDILKTEFDKMISFLARDDWMQIAQCQ